MNNISASDILSQWAEYSDFDESRKAYNMLSIQFELDIYNRKLKKFIDTFDPSGKLGVLYAKSLFNWACEETKISLTNLFSHPECISSSKHMYDVFNSEYVQSLGSTFSKSVSAAVEQVIGTKLIDTTEDFDNTMLFESLDSVVEQLIDCKYDVFAKGGAIQSLNLSSKLYVFNTLAECLLQLEQSADGMYLCYISANNRPAGYFGFYLKSGCNLISVSERLDESYIGEFSNHRNNRHFSNKKYRLFPYELVEFSGSDYKGYATEHTIKSRDIMLSDLSPDGYLPIIIAAALINMKYAGTVVEDECKYVDSLLSVNLPQLEASCKSLVKVENSVILQQNHTYSPNISEQAILDGTQYIDDPRSFPTNSCVVDTWKAGFVFDPTRVLRRDPHVLQLTDGSNVQQYNLEAVATKDKLDMLYYIDSRAQLAAYVRKQMYKEYEATGGDDTVNEWFTKLVQDNADKLLNLFIKHAAEIKVGRRANNKYYAFGVPVSEGVEHSLYIMDYPTRVRENNIVNSIKSRSYSDVQYTCYVSDYTANTWLNCQFRTWKEIEEVFEVEVPKILKGWQYLGHSPKCNTILDAHDPAAMVGNIFEETEARKYVKYTKDTGDPWTYSSPNFYRSCAIGLSKRELNKLVNQYIKEHNL